MTRRNTGATQAVRDLCFGRDGGCVCCGSTYMLQLHHRRARGMGSTRRPETNLPANLIVVCRDCHDWVESSRETALDRGLLVPQHKTPAEVPLIRHGVWCLLDDEGGVTPVEVAA